ncbi:MAG: hypothetical protein LQ349_007916 [Xanthoria aureola]|nr:MAG: hypothetical protein LQ349_007916 [Xanthoria aureola]
MPSNGVNISPDDRGPWVNLVTWILLVVTVLSVAVKGFSKWTLLHKFQYDDLLVAAAALVAVGYGVAVSLQVKAGLGKSISALSLQDTSHYQQAAYASEILYAITLCLAKLAILQYLLSLARKPRRTSAVKGCMIATILWTFIAVVSVAFQCPIPRPWELFSPRCFDQSAFWDAFAAVDISLDLACATLPIYLLRDLQLAWNRKFQVMASLATRALLVPITVTRLVYLNNASKSPNHSMVDFPVVMATTLHVYLSVIVTCIPFIKPVMDGLQTGILASNVHTTTRTQEPSLALSWLKGNSTGERSAGSPAWPGTQTQRSFATVASGPEEAQRDRGLSVSSQDGMIIKETKTVTVQIGS